MLDIRFIREHADQVKQAALDKNLPVDIDRLLELDRERVELLRGVEELKSLKNDLNDLIQKAATPEERQEIIDKGKDIKQKLEEQEPKLKGIKIEYDRLMAMVPTVPSPDTPRGKNDEENVEIERVGENKPMPFQAKTHIELGTALGLIDFERGVKVAGYRGYYLTGEGALLAMAIMHYALKTMAAHGYRPMIPPTLVKGFALSGSGYFKGQEYDPTADEIYQVATPDKDQDGKMSHEQKFLVGTAEPSLLAYYADETLDGAALPLRMSGFSPCYRSEIGSYGKDTKGLYRVHEFMKVEQVVIAPADLEQANRLQDEMRELSAGMHRELGIPYRVLQICTGDMAPGKYRAFDIEAWLPGMGRYGETGSASNFLDWQSRRLNIRYTDPKTGEKKFAFLLNNTALPSARILIAILENHQQPDGSVVVPQVLRDYVGKEKLTPKN